MALLIAMSILFIPCLILDTIVEQKGNPAFQHMGIDTTAQSELYPAGNMEGKETRFGIINSAIWATATTASSNGSVNSMLDSFTPFGGLVPLWMMHLNEVSFGGVGSGLYGMLMFVILTVFVAGLMVGRTPEYLGKKIEPYEMKMASISVLIMPLIVLITTAYASVTDMGISSIANPGAHGFTEILYAFTSMGNNNGSSFAGLNANTPFYSIVGGMLMLISRYWLAIPALAIAGSLAKKKKDSQQFRHISDSYTSFYYFISLYCHRSWCLVLFTSSCSWSYCGAFDALGEIWILNHTLFGISVLSKVRYSMRCLN